MLTYDYTVIDTGDDVLEEDLYCEFDEYIESVTPDVHIGNLTYSPAQVLREVDPTAYREMFLEWADRMVTEGVIREYIDSPVCEDCESALTQDEVTESLYIYDRLVCPSCADDEDDEDFCYECNTVTKWDDEKCTGCGRTWGYDKGMGPDDK